MKLLRFLPILALTALVSFSFTTTPDDPPAADDQLVWLTDLREAHKVSTESGKPIFAFFTGSDWCGWCRKLQADVFRKEAFVTWANENVVLLELDFPRKTQLPPELKQQNYKLQQMFAVQGYPTCWLFTTSVDQEGKSFNIQKLGQAGYPRGATPGKEEDKFIASANSILARVPQAGTQ